MWPGSLIVVVDSDLIQHDGRLVLLPVAVTHRNSLDPVQDAHPDSQGRAAPVAERDDRMDQSRDSNVHNDDWKSQRYRKQAQIQIHESHDDLHGGKFTTTQLDRYYAPTCCELRRCHGKLFCPKTGTATGGAKITSYRGSSTAAAPPGPPPLRIAVEG